MSEHCSTGTPDGNLRKRRTLQQPTIGMNSTLKKTWHYHESAAQNCHCHDAKEVHHMCVVEACRRPCGMRSFPRLNFIIWSKNIGQWWEVSCLHRGCSHKTPKICFTLEVTLIFRRSIVLSHRFVVLHTYPGALWQAVHRSNVPAREVKEIVQPQKEQMGGIVCWLLYQKPRFWQAATRKEETYCRQMPWTKYWAGSDAITRLIEACGS